MSDQKPPSAIVPSPPKALDLPVSTRLALPVVGTAALVWAGKKALTLFRNSRGTIPVGRIIEKAADGIVEPHDPAPTTQAVYIHQTNIWISIQHKRHNP